MVQSWLFPFFNKQELRFVHPLLNLISLSLVLFSSVFCSSTLSWTQTCSMPLVTFTHVVTYRSFCPVSFTHPVLTVESRTKALPSSLVFKGDLAPLIRALAWPFYPRLRWQGLVRVLHPPASIRRLSRSRAPPLHRVVSEAKKKRKNVGKRLALSHNSLLFHREWRSNQCGSEPDISLCLSLNPWRAPCCGIMWVNSAYKAPQMKPLKRGLIAAWLHAKRQFVNHPTHNYECLRVCEKRLQVRRQCLHSTNPTES